MTQNKFSQYNLSNELLKAVELLGYTEPTPVQAEVIPTALQNKDLIVKSKTGSGKTASFAIPTCELLDWEENKPQVLVLTPTRELAIQVKEDYFNIGRFKRIKVVAVYGKSPFFSQQKDLKAKTHVVVGTPGRVIDHLEKKTLDVSQVRYLVIDEADEMLNMGFVEQIESIIKQLPTDRVTMLFSATMPGHIEKLCKNYMVEPKMIEIESKVLTSDNIEQMKYEVREGDKINLLHDLAITQKPESCIIFCNTKQKVDDVYDALTKKQYKCQKIHGGMEQCDRLQVMKDFKRGYFRYLIATDVAARGIDISGITHVVNFDLPQETESYVHRIGRTGRAKNKGVAITLVTPYEGKWLDAVERYIGHAIPEGKEVHISNRADLENAFKEKMTARAVIKEDKGTAVSSEIMKLHINAGKKTKLRPVDVVGTLCNLQGMTAADIGIISILDISTFVEILNNKGESVYKQLQTTPLKGRLRKVSKANAEM